MAELLTLVLIFIYIAAIVLVLKIIEFFSPRFAEYMNRDVDQEAVVRENYSNR